MFARWIADQGRLAAKPFKSFEVSCAELIHKVNCFLRHTASKVTVLHLRLLENRRRISVLFLNEVIEKL
jgi:hypothetical protein